jgi:hypothetical protein
LNSEANTPEPRSSGRNELPRLLQPGKEEPCGRHERGPATAGALSVSARDIMRRDWASQGLASCTDPHPPSTSFRICSEPVARLDPSSVAARVFRLLGSCLCSVTCDLPCVLYQQASPWNETLAISAASVTTRHAPEFRARSESGRAEFGRDRRVLVSGDTQLRSACHSKKLIVSRHACASCGRQDVDKARVKRRFNDVATGCYRVAGFTKNSSAAGPAPACIAAPLGRLPARKLRGPPSPSTRI